MTPPIPLPLLPQTNATNLPPPSASTHHRLLAPLTGATASFSVFLFLILFCHRLFRRRPPPSSDHHTESLRRFSYSSLRRATSSFASSRRLGQGGFGAVYSGTLSDKKLKKRLDVAVKVMDSGSLQGEREFHNEILMANKLCNSDYVVHLLGFASDRRRRRMCLVYELMANGNLQECLLHRKCEELMSWSRRRQIVIEVAKGLAYLHHQCDPPVIHGDVKPSNVLLDENFSAKIGDFGLARLKLVDPSEISINCGEDDLTSLKNGNKKDELRIHVAEDTGSVVETESVITLGLEEASIGVDQSPENFVRVPVVETSPEMFSAVASPSELLEIVEEPKPAKVKDYVMEWIGSEIDKERSAGNWMGIPSTSAATVVKPEQKKKSKDKKHRLDWWMAMDDDLNLNKPKRRPIREWWKEDSEDVAKKSKKKRKKKIKQQGEMNDNYHNEDTWWPRDDEMMYVDSKMKSKRRKNSRGNLEWWLDGLSGDLWKARHISFDSMSGDIPKSGGISSTPSMRGTVCYIAPEYSSGGDLSEKCDVYSFGVLLLVVIAGRRPLQVSGSPMSEYQSANLLSWARKLARTGKLLDLVDKKVEPLNTEEAQVCIKVALLCLQKSPARRPSMKDVVGILTGELDAPCLPPELSPSRPTRFPYKSQKKVPNRHTLFLRDLFHAV
ncbi:hypothetical protein V2J09_014522 [Rumex salicifolius]